ncbi:putative alkaline serine protease AorO [Pseudovirgaria hyperparasitica]|uniref:tripeptidyl-peptidase II n=1 Tax=Pseudovirgaria hyperparasitica TaxID=470096 RepID=A0A6A6WLP6_9PEZI|nr:putative alkaline serine protease AorO [Pseudovirgaria hyperparasitica]KAF2763111.1 putative alkaline serine protease AorO [Pseudovirgaria hyperparasitica]
MRFKQLALLSALVGSALTLTTPSQYEVHEKRNGPLRRWVKLSEVDSTATLPMRIGLTQRNILNGEGDRLLHEISHPDSERYGQIYSADEVIEIFAPSQDTVDAVREWLVEAGIAKNRISQSINKQWMQMDLDVKEAEKLLKTKYYNYEHKKTGAKTVACDEYHLPSHIREHVDYVTLGLKLLAGGKASSGRDLNARKRDESLSSLNSSNPLSMCDSMVTPECIATMYNITKATKAAKGNELGIFEEGDYYSETDLVEFFATFAPNIPLLTQPILRGIDGGFAPMAVAGGESNLDFQISYPIIYPQNSVLFQTDDIFYASGLEGGGGFLNTFLDAIDGSYCNYTAFGLTGNSNIDPVYPNPNPLGYQGKLQCGVYKPTHVISISYGEQEDDLPTNYQQRQCSEFMKLGMQGVTTVIASGDSGVAARSTDDGNDDGCLGNGEVFNPDFPASCPYITAAGSTYLPAGADVKKDEEISTTRFPSGGGFSNIYPQPAYQKDAVNTYLTQHTPPYKTYSTSGTNNPPETVTNGGIYNVAGRGYPDISAVGDNVVIILNGLPTLIGGTSASAPVFAAVVNRINEERIAVGKNTVGFINPALYAHPEVLHDITNGTNPGCNTQGFSASKGWDPVSGLGTPNYPAMLKYFMSLK